MDAYEAIKEIPDKSIDLIYTDIPYEISYSGSGSVRKLIKNFVDEMNANKENLLQGIDFAILNEFVRVLKKIHIYIWCSRSQILPLLKFFVEEKHCSSNLLFWGKTNPVPFGGGHFLSDVEYLLVFYESGCRYNTGIENKHKYYISSTNQKDKALYEHPTIKPLEFVKRHILNATQAGDVVLDPFSGSGTTAVACKETGRQFIAFEKDIEYYNKSIDRLNGISQLDKRMKDSGIQTIFDYGVEESTEE